MPKRVRRNRAFSDEQVIEILRLTGSETDKATACRLNCSESTIRHIRCGRSYKFVAPEIPRASGKRFTERKLSEEAVEDVLTSCESGKRLAERYGVSIKLIQRVRRGEVYKDLCPDLPRFTMELRRVSHRKDRWIRPEQNNIQPIQIPVKPPEEKTCKSCVYYSSTPATGAVTEIHHCDFDFPEIKKKNLGIRFAKECLHYTAIKEEASCKS